MAAGRWCLQGVLGISCLGFAIAADLASPSQAAVDALFDYGSRNAQLERTWFKAIGFDPDRAELPEIADVL